MALQQQHILSAQFVAEDTRKVLFSFLSRAKQKRDTSSGEPPGSSKSFKSKLECLNLNSHS